MAQRGKGEGSVRKRKDGRWEGSITTGKTASGNPKRRSVYGKTRKEVTLKLTDLTSKFNYGTLLEPDKRTVQTFATQWLEMKALTGLAAKTISNYRDELEKAYGVLGGLKLQDVKPLHVREVIKALAVKGISGRTQAKVLERLNCVFREALTLELIYKNPCVPVKLKAVPSAPVGKTMQMSEVTALLKAVEGDYWDAFVRLCLTMGLRKGEALALKWDDVDLLKSCVMVSKSFSKLGGRGVMGATKNRKNRVLPIPPELAKILLRRYEGWGLRPEIASSFYLFGVDGPANPSTPNHVLKRLCTRAGIEPVRVHDLRHTYGSLSLRAGVPLEVVSERMGHSNPTVTLNIYRHLLEDERQSHVLDIEDMLRPLESFSSPTAVKLRSNATAAVN